MPWAWSKPASIPLLRKKTLSGILPLPLENPLLDRDSLQVAVVFAYALPSLSLSFGFVPAREDLDAAAALLEPSLKALRPWELAVLLWGAARLGYHPGGRAMEVNGDLGQLCPGDACGTARAAVGPALVV
jgi:hypothetical protein